MLILALAADVPGIDAVLGESPRAFREAGEEQVAVVVEVAYDGDRNADPVEPLHDVRHRARRGVGVDGDAHQLAAGLRQRSYLRHGRWCVRGVSVGHRLDHNGVVRADGNAADHYGGRAATGVASHDEI